MIMSRKYPALGRGDKQAMSRKAASTVLKAAISNGILGPPSLVYQPGGPQHASLFYDLNEFEAGLDRAEQAFRKGNYNLPTSDCDCVTDRPDLASCLMFRPLEVIERVLQNCQHSAAIFQLCSWHGANQNGGKN